MAKIKLPKDVLEKVAFKSLPAKDKEEYLNNLLKITLDLNPKGITISQIKVALELPSSTIWHHLEVLNHTAQCRKISRANVDVFYPIGKIEHLNDFNKGKVRYTIDKVENADGNFIFIHEIRESRLGNETISKGVAIPIELLDDFINALKKFKEAKK